MCKKERTVKDWIIASRPWSFTASLIPIISISAYLFYLSRQDDLNGDWWNALLALPMLVFLQAAGNLISDYHDHKKGVDMPGSLNGVRHIQSGMFAPKEILHYGYVMLFLGAAIGFIILCRSSFSVIWIGIAGLLLAYCYPWLKFHALGDLDVLLGYALLPALGVSYVITGNYHPSVLLLSLPFGLLTVAILHANNTRDILSDHRAGICTFSMLIGGQTAKWIYVIELLLPFLLISIYFFVGMLLWPSLITFIMLPMAISNVRTMLKAQPLASEPIRDLDHKTALLQMLFGLLFAISFILAAFWL